MPISYMAISAYARDHGIAGRNFVVFKRVIHLLDGVYLEMEAQRDEAAKQSGEPG